MFVEVTFRVKLKSFIVLKIVWQTLLSNKEIWTLFILRKYNPYLKDNRKNDECANPVLWVVSQNVIRVTFQVKKIKLWAG